MSTKSVSANAVIVKDSKVLVSIPGLGSVNANVIGVHGRSFVVSYTDDFGLKCVSPVSRQQIQAVR